MSTEAASMLTLAAIASIPTVAAIMRRRADRAMKADLGRLNGRRL